MNAITHRRVGRRLAVMGGAYGNVPALDAAIAHARASGCDLLAFNGDATGCCGHSDETIERIRRHFDLLVAGNHEQQAARGSLECGCDYSSAEDERHGCLAHAYAMASLGEENRQSLGRWPALVLLDAGARRILLCHGSPDRTNEFLYESELDEARVHAWLRKFDAHGFVCTHSGLPWIRRLGGGRFAANCGVVGKPDHDGDPAVHFAIIELGERPAGAIDVRIERVTYDHHAWADQLAREGVDDVFVRPLRTGIWTCGVASLPPAYRAPQQRLRIDQPGA